MRILPLLAVLFVILVPSRVICDDDIRFDHIDLRDRSSQSRFRGIVQDATGYMWFGNRYGLHKYDGYNFRSFKHDPNTANSLSNNSITQLCVDSSGLIWIGTETGSIDRFDPVREQFRRYFLPSGTAVVASSKRSIERLSLDRQGIPWAVTDAGNAYYYNPDADGFVLFGSAVDIAASELGSHSILQVFEDSSGQHWISFEGRGPYWFDKNAGITSPAGGGENVYDFTAFGDAFLFEDSRQRIWIGTWGGGLVRFDRETIAFIQVSDSWENRYVEAARFINTIIEDDSGNLWIGTSDSGLITFNPDLGTYSHFTHDPTDQYSLSSNKVKVLYVDHSATVWVGTSHGLNKYSKYKYKFLGSETVISQEGDEEGAYVFSLFADSTGVLWVGSLRNRLSRYRPSPNDTGEYFPVALEVEMLSTPYVIYEDSNRNLYMGTSDLGLLWLDRESNQLEQITMGQHVTDVVESRDGTLFFGTYVNGLGMYDSASGNLTYWKPQARPDNTLSSLDITVVCEDRDGNIWLGTEGEGLVQIFPDRRSFINYRHSSIDSRSMSDNRVISIIEDAGGVIWVGTRNGFNRFDPIGREFTRYYEKDGLPDNVICGILSDNSGYLWLSTIRGLARFEPQSGESRSYDFTDGLQGYEFIPGAHFKSESGTLYFGAVNGFYAFDPAELDYNIHPPTVVITSFRKLNEEVAFDKPIATVEKIDLPYNQNIFSFEFVALDYADMDKNQYEYMLEGHDKEWIQAGNRRFASYSQVPPGNYVFRVRGSNNDSVWNQTGVSMPLIVIPPFWMTWEFRIAVALFVVAALVTGYTVRVRSIKRQRELLQKEVDERRAAEVKLLANQTRLRAMSSELTLAEEKERRRIAGALHDQIGHALFSAKVKLNEQVEEAAEQQLRTNLHGIIATVDETLEHTRSLTAEISPPSLYRFGFEAAAEGLLERVNNDFQIESVLNVESVSPPDEETSILLYQSLRELLHNVVKHANAERVKVTITGDDEQFIVKLNDNGTGFDAEKTLSGEGAKGGYGLFSIQQRLESIGGRLIVKSSAGNGSEITMVTPLAAGEEEPN